MSRTPPDAIFGDREGCQLREPFDKPWGATALPSFTRHPGNPVLTAADWPTPVATIGNPGAAHDGHGIVLLCGVEDRRGMTTLNIARSRDGVGDWSIESQPLIEPRSCGSRHWSGVRDGRLTWVPELNGWVIAFTAFGHSGTGVALAFTSDFKDVVPLGVAAPPDDQSGVLLPRRADGEFVLLHRPMSPMSLRADVWSSRSPDLLRWHGSRPVLPARPTPWWDSAGVGVGPPPIETDHGWLTVYSGDKRVDDRTVRRVGMALLDRDDPTRVTHRGDEWVLEASEPYETGRSPTRSVTPSGAVIDVESRALRLYYGVADSGVCLATADLDEVLTYLLNQPVG
ncbi:glycosidase-like protein [Stackebrandtia nassauensis]|uniref:Glycosidase PH1107-related protein n=1 Tax=Stackebrandtia nassauensis (strain DSM 44728 / CIP 108903 / NRRL B-16338 / NBRC 102104 / LLR-40K-21) TaxID=446470 RepID=D3PVI7_STANL|nr:glycosidase-like protein [Stackebrandtia nassauensis]ADD43101.1 glycosidase PH1107-related protein [Stackebrandtia nassauensis DSM 44728]